jgi:hypothetical protein
VGWAGGRGCYGWQERLKLLLLLLLAILFFLFFPESDFALSVYEYIHLQMSVRPETLNAVECCNVCHELKKTFNFNKGYPHHSAAPLKYPNHPIQLENIDILALETPDPSTKRSSCQIQLSAKSAHHRVYIL